VSDEQTVARRVHLRTDYLEGLTHVAGPLGISNLVNAALRLAMEHPEEIKEITCEIRELYGTGKAHTRWVAESVSG